MDGDRLLNISSGKYFMHIQNGKNIEFILKQKFDFSFTQTHRKKEYKNKDYTLFLFTWVS